MGSIAYYEQLISESYAKIRKCEKQINGLKDFLRENRRGAEEFSTKISQRRKVISGTISTNVRHPMVKRLDTRLSTAIDCAYENNVLSNFQAVEEDIIKAIYKLEEQIQEMKCNITFCQGRISDIEEEERRAAEARRAEEERRTEEARKEEATRNAWNKQRF